MIQESLKTVPRDRKGVKEEAQDRLADFTTDIRVLRISLLAVAIGAVSAIVAWILLWLIGLMTNLSFYHTASGILRSPAQNHLGLLVILIPAIGGLIIGLMARYGSERIRGHGIPEALEAILIGGSRIEPKVALLKPISSAISIGTGGPFGAEGPIIMTGGALGSLVAQFFHLTAAERKTLLVAGAAGGMAAVFATPVAAVLLAVELLLFEWKPRSFIPVALASIVAAVLRVPLLGAGAVFATPAHAALPASGLAIAFVVGIVAGFGSGLLTALVYGFEDIFRKLPIHWMWWPILGGLVVGIGGFFEPRALGVGYDTIRDLLNDRLVLGVVLGLVAVKALIWSCSLGSGTSGGVLAPLLIMGGALGAVEAHFIPLGCSGQWVMISMAAIMGGTMRSPFTATVFALELTHDWNMLPAVFIGCIAAQLVTVLLMRRSILTEKVARRGHHISREYSVDPYQLLRVEDIMDKDVACVPADMKLGELSERIAAQDSNLIAHHALPIIDHNGGLVGIITRGDILRALQSDPDARQMTVVDAGSTPGVVAYADELVRDALFRMLRRDIGRLLIVDRHEPTRLIGYLGRPGILEAQMRLVQEEHVRERVWAFSKG